MLNVIRGPSVVRERSIEKLLLGPPTQVLAGIR
jgi:hypothetical protein